MFLRRKTSLDLGFVHPAVPVDRFLVGRLQDLEGAQERLVHRHERSGVVELSAEVRRREDGDQLTLGKKLVAVLYNLKKSSVFTSAACCATCSSLINACRIAYNWP